jgi:hypothetical protein
MKGKTEELKSLTRASLLPWPMRRIPAIAMSMLLFGALAACGGGQPATIPALGLGISLHDAEKLFRQLGGEGWTLGAYTGGHVGYAGGNASGHFCPTQLSGPVRNLNHIYVGCLNEAVAPVTPEETAAVIEATVHRVVPDATDWARQTMTSLNSSSSTTSVHTKISGPNYLSISKSPAGVVLVIEPLISAEGQRLPGTPGATSTTG